MPSLVTRSAISVACNFAIAALTLLRRPASTSVQTWYFCLPLSIALVLGWRRRIARISLAYSALALPALYLSYYLRESTPAWIFLVYACAPLAVLIPDALRALRPPRVAPALASARQRQAPQATPSPVMERASR